jgi:hypothetical protein
MKAMSNGGLDDSSKQSLDSAAFVFLRDGVSVKVVKAEDVIVAGSIGTKHGIRHLMIMAPQGLRADVSAHCSFFDEVAHGLVGVKIIFQNAPVPTGAASDERELRS